MIPKVAVISGTSHGLGNVIASHLLEDDFKIYGISRTEPDIHKSSFTWLKADLRDVEAINHIPSLIQEDKIDLLVNCAGIHVNYRSLEFNNDDFHHIYNLNFVAPILITQSLKNKLSHGTVITISSTSDRYPEENMALYCSSKAALNIYFDVISLEHKDVKIITILPEYVDTPLLRKVMEGQNFSWDKAVKPQQVADFVGKIMRSPEKYQSGIRIAVLPDKSKDGHKNPENLWVYNVDTNKLSKSK